MRYTENAPLNADLCTEWRRHARRCAIACFKELFEVFEKRRETGTVVNLPEATNMNLYRDAYFLHRIAKPAAEAARSKRRGKAE